MKRSQFYGLIALGAALAALPGWAWAQETAAADKSAPKAEQPSVRYILLMKIDDPAFNQYVDIRLLEPAWVTKDADLLTDLALQLAQGEKILKRPHKVGSAEDLLKLASSIATRKGNKDAIARIEKAAKELNFADAAAEALSAAKLSAVSRKADPNVTVQVDQANLKDIADYGLLIDGVQSAEILRDAIWLNDVEQRLDQYKNLTDGQREYLTKIIGEARSSIGEQPSDNSVVATIAKLEGESRHCGYSWGGHHGGGHYGGWGHHGGGWDHYGGHHGWDHYGGHHGWDHYGGHHGWDHYGGHHGHDYGHHH